MKREYLFFLVMVLAAAVITGATIGFISNFHHIEKQIQENLSQVEPAQQQASAPNSKKQNDNIKSEAVNPEGKDNNNTANEVKKVAVVPPATTSTEQGYLVLSGEEKQQIVDMLVSLGATKNDDYSTFIRNFQRDKSLPPTGSLDSLTLNAIINEVTRQRAAQIANG
ncbi:MAG: hypothetical protein PHR04_07385 [Syntrophomonadaceae bacterium]|nr:hypothetical protein [Syntrophomonadaceae bacterium]MDD3271897.1 hypothetical protein [Syntrophomonadaceae bacterium]MDD4562927.1 hypothetical protein [Syntrophomonadaceae bacterium]